ncbi:hypothetical protein [Deferrisoma palaeochoriense]
MAGQGDSLIRKTQKGLSVLAFETTKQSRILKKRMRIAALQKEIKADLRDLGNLVYNAVVNGQTGILEEEEVKLLVESIRKNREEIEHLRDAIARLSRAKKHFPEEEAEAFGAAEEAPAPQPDEPALAEVEPEPTPPVEETPVEEARDLEEAVLEPEAEPKPKKEEPGVPPPPGTDPGHPGPEAEGEKSEKS